MTDKEITEYLNENEIRTIQSVCDTLKSHETNIRTHLADFVASLCHVPRQRLFANTRRVDIVQARWFFLYAYRYMTGETYDKIGLIVKEHGGKSVSPFGVANGVCKMASIIKTEPIWKKRWTIIRTIIRTYNESNEQEEKKPDETIVIIAPKRIKIEIKREEK